MEPPTVVFTVKRIALTILGLFILVGVTFTAAHDTAPVVHDTKTVQVSVPQTIYKTKTKVVHESNDKCKQFVDASLRVLKIASDQSRLQGELESLLDAGQKNLFEKDLVTQVKLQDQIKKIRYDLSEAGNEYGLYAVTMNDYKGEC